MTRLGSAELHAALSDLPGWDVEGDAIHKTFTFKTFRRAIAFVNEVAAIASEARHHPDILIRYNRVDLTLTTHDEGGITEKDVTFARQVEERQEQTAG